MTRDYLLLQYVNFDGGLTGVRRGPPCSESRSQISLVPVVISFEGIIVIFFFLFFYFYFFLALQTYIKCLQY